MSDEIIERMAQAAYCDSYTQYGTATPQRWKETSETQRQFFRGQMRAVAAVLVAAGLLAACAGKEELPPLPPAADMCSLYSSYRYNAAAAAVEATDALDKHNSNERVFYDRCVTNAPQLDPKRSGGPR